MCCHGECEKVVYDSYSVEHFYADLTTWFHTNFGNCYQTYLFNMELQICIKIKPAELNEAKYFFVAIFVKEFTEYISMLSFEQTF